MTPLGTDKHLVNHFGIMLDASGSMSRLAPALIKSVDALIVDLAKESLSNGQETRISIWAFDYSHRIVNLIWDMDVVRVPSIKGLYDMAKFGGQTALIDATIKLVDDFDKVAAFYGDHAFVGYIFTDGHENDSKQTAMTLAAMFNRLPARGNWTLGAMVPDFNSQRVARGWGFPAGNVAIWDTSSEAGLEAAVKTMTTANTAYMTARSTGTRSSTNLFGGDATVNTQTIAAAGLVPMDPAKYMLLPVPAIPDKTWISDWVRSAGHTYVTGNCFYELSKRERVSGIKKIAILEKATSKVYVGLEARKVLGLPDGDIRIAPAHNTKYKIFVQSTSQNRHLVSHTQLLMLI